MRDKAPKAPRPDPLDALEAKLLAKFTKQLDDLDAKDVDGEPLWDPKARNDLYRTIGEFLLKRKGSSGPPMGGKLGGD